MPLPSTTFADFTELANYIDSNIVPNGMELIDGEEMNNVTNGLLTFIEQSPLNWQTAQVISTGGVISTTRPIAVFITNTPTSLSWADNIYNQYIFINTTGSAISLASGFHYYDINLVAKSTIPSKTIISIVKASNGLWINSYNSASASTTPDPLQFIVASSGTTFVDGQTSATLTSFIGYNILFARGGIPQSDINTQPSYYSYDSLTGLLTISPQAYSDELFQIYPV